MVNNATKDYFHNALSSGCLILDTVILIKKKKIDSGFLRTKEKPEERLYFGG